MITYPEAVKMLQENGIDQGDEEDLSTASEKFLGKLIKAKVNLRTVKIITWVISNLYPTGTMRSVYQPTQLLSYNGCPSGYMEL